MTNSSNLDNNSYNPLNIENKWQKIWQDLSVQAPNFEHKNNFCIQLPPPNVTGSLHMGHAFNQTIMDTLARYARMNGKNTLWVPGTDHAGIATQIVVCRQLEQQNIQPKNLSRNEFIEHVWSWKNKSGNSIKQQIKRLGSSISWEHEYFTMDEKMSKAVIKAFVRLYEDGLIYKGSRLVNWDPKLQTAVSDLEVQSQEESGSMWHICYPLSHDTNQYLTVATTRPETMFGDVAVMVNPEDERYKYLIGKRVNLPLTNRSIPIIADEYVDISFGTGVVKVTPAHDFNDYAVAQRHNLPLINIFTLQAYYNQEVPPKFVGLERFEARNKILSELESLNLLLKIQKHNLMIPRCERSGEIIEPMLTKQWFMDLSAKGNQLIIKPALDAVTSKQIKIIPEQWQNTYENWLINIQDWCISRQLLWGHQIPAWYSEDDDGAHVFVAHNLEEAKKQAEQKGYIGNLKQDSDVLDTWFSSALVPFSSLGWGSNEEEFEHMQQFLPSSTSSNVLVTGYDIIFFWVARMVMMTKYFTGKIPFDTVYVHGLVRDADGKKMSKSEGNTLDPVDLIDGITLENLLIKRTQGLRRPETSLQVIAKTKQNFPNGIAAFGTDALRFTFASLASLGRSINFDSKRCEGYKNFCNKLWNATKFVVMNLDNKHISQPSSIENIISELTFADHWMLDKLNQSAQKIHHAFANYRLDIVANTIYQLIWEEFCDWYIEIAKIQMQIDENIASNTRYLLVYCLDNILKLLHPIMPFITEELAEKISPYTNHINHIANQYTCLALAQYPLFNLDISNKINSTNSLSTMQLMQDIISACRNLRSEMKISPTQKVELEIATNLDLNKTNILPYVKTLAKISIINISSKLEDSNLPSVILPNISLRLNLPIDIKAETQKIIQELPKIEQEIQKLKIKLATQAFIDKAPVKVVEQEKQRLQQLIDSQKKMLSQLKHLQQMV